MDSIPTGYGVGRRRITSSGQAKACPTGQQSGNQYAKSACGVNSAPLRSRLGERGCAVLSEGLLQRAASGSGRGFDQRERLLNGLDGGCTVAVEPVRLAQNLKDFGILGIERGGPLGQDQAQLGI